MPTPPQEVRLARHAGDLDADGHDTLDPDAVAAAGRWEVVVSGSAPPVAVSTPADDDWVYAWVED